MDGGEDGSNVGTSSVHEPHDASLNAVDEYS